MFEKYIPMAHTKQSLAKDWDTGGIRRRRAFDPAANHRSGEFLAGAHIHGPVGCVAGVYCPNFKLPSADPNKIAGNVVKLKAC